MYSLFLDYSIIGRLENMKISKKYSTAQSAVGGQQVPRAGLPQGTLHNKN